MKAQKRTFKEEKIVEDESEEESGEENGEEEVDEGVEGSDDDELDTEDMLEMEAVFGLRKLEDMEASGSTQVFFFFVSFFVFTWLTFESRNNALLSTIALVCWRSWKKLS